VRILIDLDSTVADMLTAFLERYNLAYSDSLDVAQLTSYDLGTHVRPEAAHHYHKLFQTDGFFRDLQPYPGAVEVINAWKTTGDDIHFVTATPAFAANCVNDKFAWVQKHFPWATESDVSVVSGSARATMRADVLIDDRPSTLLAFKQASPESRAWCIAFPYNAAAEGVADIRAQGFADPGAAWEQFRIARTLIAPLVPAQQVCLAPLPTGQLCRRVGCTLHPVIGKAGFYRKDVWDLVHRMSTADMAADMTPELAVVREMVTKIEADQSLMARDKYKLMLEAATQATQIIDRKEKQLIARQELVPLSSVLGALEQVYTIIQRYVKDTDVVKTIGRDIARIQFKQAARSALKKGAKE